MPTWFQYGMYIFAGIGVVACLGVVYLCWGTLFAPIASPMSPWRRIGTERE